MCYRHRPSAGLFPIIVSQDCGHQPTAQAIARYSTRVTHLQQPDLSDPILTSERKKTVKNSSALKGYLKISRHYKWALSQVFEELNYAYAIIVEGEERTPAVLSMVLALPPPSPSLPPPPPLPLPQMIWR